MDKKYVISIIGGCLVVGIVPAIEIGIELHDMIKSIRLTEGIKKSANRVYKLFGKKYPDLFVMVDHQCCEVIIDCNHMSLEDAYKIQATLRRIGVPSCRVHFTKPIDL